MEMRNWNPDEYSTFKFKEFEYETECNECYDPLLVVVPKNIQKKIAEKKDDDIGTNWMGENFFYCKKCQKEYDYRARE